MPVLWSLSHSVRLVTITVTGDIRLQDMEDCLAGIMTPATQSYRKLVDMTEGASALGQNDVTALARRVREYAGKGSMGPLAIVATYDEEERQARLFGALNAVDRPMSIFREMQAARDWLDAQPSPPPGRIAEEDHLSE